MEKIHLERHNTLIAEVKTAVPLTEEEKNKLVEKLEKKYDKKVLLDDSIEKKLIGGVYVRVGDDVIDGTIKHKLEELKKRILD